ncbi:galactosyltransferase-related protein [Acetobacteraceae bacterium KSS8]|uniref:Galactosyltransferase-related protein n=1 Tax=Endosaccharibacter trunci TaxID=2812733 RepID=A0ABT1WCA6_9PROT|nr:galactosyltransferase-related protein [Acetobacteraceae bacterium KSS8]
MGDVSVLTLARGRGGHLRKVMQGLAMQTVPPAEMIIAVMQPQPFADLPPMPFPVRQIPVPGEMLPLAGARNRVAREATGRNLVFLDIDCIPDPTLVADYRDGLAALDGLLMGEVLYLDDATSRGPLDFEHFATVAEKHSDRQGPPGQRLRICEDYRCFWSLTFAIRRDTFLATGGFDERYVGYGGEDTDFGKTLDQIGVPIAWLRGARSYHQHHPHHMPPVHHLESVVRNAELFEEKWGYRTMGHWLDAFARMGLIDNAPDRKLRILRPATEQDLSLTRQHGHQPYSNTASVIRKLQERATQAGAIQAGAAGGVALPAALVVAAGQVAETGLDA